MESLPYSIYIKKRPIKIAFLVDSGCNTGLLDEIFKYNQEKWGGRFNPIIFTNGRNITAQEWEFLRKYDPDIIKSFVNITQKRGQVPFY